MSANVIVYTNRIDFKTLLEIECKGLTGFAPVIKNTVDELKSFLSLVSDIDIFVIDSPNEEVLSVFTEEINVKHVLALSNDQVALENAECYSSKDMSSLISHLKTILSPNGSSQEGYISIPVDSLVHFKILPFDLFIKISDSKFLKRIPANESIDESTLDAFKAKGITELHFEKKHNRDFSLMLLNNMINKVESDYSTKDAKLKATNEVFLTTKEIVQSVGLPPKVIQVCESVIDRITTDVTTNKDKLSQYLKQVQSASNLNFQFRFIELSSFIATQIVDLSFENSKDEYIKTIVFAAFFCDIALKETDQVEFRDEASIQDLWVEDQKLIIEHAYKASEIVSKYKNAPPMAGEIVKQHHGSLDGKGFPKVFSPSLLPLSKCLIAAQELAFGILKNTSMPTNEVVRNIVQKFEGTVIHEPLVLFENSCNQS